MRWPGRRRDSARRGSDGGLPGWAPPGFTVSSLEFLPDAEAGGYLHPEPGGTAPEGSCPGAYGVVQVLAMETVRDRFRRSPPPSSGSLPAVMAALAPGARASVHLRGSYPEGSLDPRAEHTGCCDVPVSLVDSARLTWKVSEATCPVLEHDLARAPAEHEPHDPAPVTIRWHSLSCACAGCLDCDGLAFSVGAYTAPALPARRSHGWEPVRVVLGTGPGLGAAFPPEGPEAGFAVRATAP